MNNTSKSEIEPKNKLIHVPDAEPEEFYERAISATFENGGSLEVTARGESIAGVIEIILNIVRVVKLNPDHCFNFTLRYWHLTEDLQTVELTALECKVPEFDYDQPQRMVRRMATTAKTALLKKLARHQIALIGTKGQLK